MVVQFIAENLALDQLGRTPGGYLHGAMDRCPGYSGRQPRLPASPPTTSEPWILLPYLYTLRDSGIYAEYNHRSMILAIEDFCEMLPGGPEGTRYFLDKTPRYHLVSDEIVAKSWCRRYLHWIGRDRLAIMGYDLDDLVADLDSLPTSYRRVGSDVGRGCWGIVRVESHPRTQVAGWRF